MEIKNLVEWNPWWENKAFLNSLMGTPRPRYQKLVNSTKIKEITVITGVRRSGKSTLMYHMISNLLKDGVSPKQILYVNLEDIRLINDSIDDIYLSYRENINLDKFAYIFLDEIHRKQDWEAWIRKKYDMKSNDKFIITGSCSYLLKKEYSSLLTGRNLSFEVYPLGFDEFLSFKNIIIKEPGIILEKTKIAIHKHLKEYLNLGGFPEVLYKPEEYKESILRQYFDDIVYKDIIDRYNLNSQKAKDLALFFMTNFTKILSLRSIRNTLGLSYDTIKDYLSYYLESFLFFTSDHFSYSFKEQKTTPSKIYCIDNGLRTAVSFKFSQDEGRLAENLVFLELKKAYGNVYYWKENKEVDFIVKKPNNDLIAFNVSYSNSVEKREIDSLNECSLRLKLKKQFIITKDVEEEKGNIHYIPLWKFLLFHNAFEQ